jgi:hypothetical protein
VPRSALTDQQLAFLIGEDFLPFLRSGAPKLAGNPDLGDRVANLAAEAHGRSLTPNTLSNPECEELAAYLDIWSAAHVGGDTKTAMDLASQLQSQPE